MGIKFRRLIGVILAGAVVFGCTEEENKYAAPPPPEVTVAKPKVKDVTEYEYYTGQTVAKDSVEIRARVTGFLQKIHFTDGHLVQEGDLLFTIDPREYKAELDSKKADLKSAQAAYTYARNDLERREKAYKARAISEVDLLSSRSERDKARASVAAAKAAVETAALNLSYTEIRAPITGRVSRHLVDQGNLVGADGATLLTTIVRLKPIYVFFSVNERDIVRYLREISIQDRRGKKGEDTRPPHLEMALDGDEGHPHKGVVDYMDSEVDPDTGTIQSRGELPNENLLIVPGLFAKIRIPMRVRKNALLVPDLAVGTDQAGRYVLIVDQEDVVQHRSVETGQLEGAFRVIEKGLESDDRVVVKGILRARPGARVKPIESKEEEKSTKDDQSPAAGARQNS